MRERLVTCSRAVIGAGHKRPVNFRPEFSETLQTKMLNDFPQPNTDLKTLNNVSRRGLESRSKTTMAAA